MLALAMVFPAWGGDFDTFRLETRGDDEVLRLMLDVKAGVLHDARFDASGKGFVIDLKSSDREQLEKYCVSILPRIHW
ncbi:MAG: hypothetical protein IPM27_11890 [Nitrosomonadales bacterium]|nr:hypothetical protein [Nitrosomonadales bacterium]